MSKNTLVLQTERLCGVLSFVQTRKYHILKSLKYNLLVILALSFAVGCQDSSEISEFQGRLDAALALESETDRNNALAQCAETSANAGDGEIVKEAIANISEKTIRDVLGLKCSRILARSGATSTATEVAENIDNPTMRQNALKEIARGTN